jgi:hypothetical protein
MVTTATLNYKGKEFKTSREDEIAPTLLHEALVNKTLSLSEHGACGGTVSYRECTDCKTKLFSYDSLKAVCNFDTPLSSENGISKHTCVDCGLIIDYTRALEETLPCKESGIIGYSIKIGTAQILKDAFFSVDRSLCKSFAESCVLDLNILTGNTSCTKEIAVKKCVHCDALVGFDGEYEILCGGGALPEPKDVIASDGTEMKRYEIHCSDCELSFIIDEYYTENNGVKTLHTNMKIFDGKELAYEINDSKTV